MKTKVIIYFEGNELEEGRHTENIGSAIVSMGLKVGDKFNIYPFNYFNDEETNYKGETAEYHVIDVKIDSINNRIIQTWNGLIRAEVEIFISQVN